MQTLKKLPQIVPNTAAVINATGELSQSARGGSLTVQRYHLMLDSAFP
jgi:hypothetical protein